MNEVRYRRPLNKEQRSVLDVLFKFRFATAEQFSHYFDKPNGVAVQKRLRILEAQGYIAKRYDGSYKLAGRPAEYYLLPKGLRFLQANDAKENKDKPPRITEQAIKNRYKDKTASDAFMKHSCTVFVLSLKHHDLYGDKMHLMPKLVLQPFDFMIQPLPDAYMYKDPANMATRKHWFIEVFEDDIPLFVIIRRIKKYLRYYQEDEWPNDNKPAVLFLTQSVRRQKQVHRRIAKELNEAYLDEDDILFATSTLGAVINASSTKDKVWQLVDEAKTMKALSSIS